MDLMEERRMRAETDQLLTIEQASQLTGLSAHTLRYYERIDLLSPVGRAPSGHRRYSQQDLERIRFLSYLRLTGMPLEQLKAYTALLEQGEAGIPGRMALLQAHREQVALKVDDLRRMLGVIDYKLATLAEQRNEASKTKHAKGGS
jgi:DNA-binding transcriptional MerR regulator